MASERVRTPQTRVVNDSSGVELVLLDPDPETLPRWATGIDPEFEIGNVSGDEAEEL